ncbi:MULTISPECIES: hypothetical protein [Halorubrum]|jgi:hypothetical protein|uniref:hypothetical protein n=1 Tax=Halorubrum TaxID=56688 RepID=UPI000F85A40C|nr:MULTISPECIES: hypothetical protein [Halorubrum]AZQ15381.1 hypothetical protein DOS48_11360 [Halorubrum sp. PV6]
MYDRTFGTEWDDLTRKEAVDRAFALGVADGVGSSRPTELERVLDAFENAYDRSLIELAYDEGRTEALEAAASADADSAEEVWKTLVDGAGSPRGAPISAALPGAITELTLTRRPREGPPSSLDFPSMLRK